jgi:Helicase associated domain
VVKQTVGWDIQYEKLVQYRNEHDGDCNVSENYPPDKPFGKWVRQQRLLAQIARGKVFPHRGARKKLNDIGFQWRVRVEWGVRYEQLVQYHKEHGDCNAPWPYPPDESFGLWVKTQRRQLTLKLRAVAIA